MSKSSDLEKEIVKLLTSHIEKEKKEGCNLALKHYSRAIVEAIRYRYPGISHVDSEEIAQKVRIIFYRNVTENKYIHEGKVEGYLRKIAVYQTLKYIEKQKGNLGEDQFVFYRESEPLFEIEDYLEKDANDQRRVKLFYECVEKLPNNLKEVYWRHYEDDQRVAQIARDLGKSVASIKGYLFNLRNLLRACVKGRQQL